MVDMIKRSLVAIIGLPIVLVVLILGNKYVLDVIVAILAVLGIYEYMKCVGNKFKPVSWIGYLAAISIAFLHIIPQVYITTYLPLVILGILAILFMHVVFTDMKINFADIAISLIGIVYVVGFFAFVALLYAFEKNGQQLGKFYIAYLFLATWGSDIFAFLVGVKFGKHKFSKISPKKSIEGCLAGTFAGVILVIIAAIIFNNCFDLQNNYIIIGIIALIINLLGQIGDFSASCIKRYSEVKDFSNLLPGHGGIIDRFDSVIFAAPFAYYLLTLLI
ncbi:MAG: phosphatidate cytidylyltransferase [Clostridia bacterium]|nr:phosphatidate cytidylyltransferase [Clostridia bacterium]